MLRLTLDRPRRGPLHVLCLGAHPDDIEIGCGGTLLALAARRPIAVDWIVFSGAGGVREREARDGARRFLRRTAQHHVEVLGFRDGFFPAAFTEIKEYFESLRAGPDPDLIFSHWLDDRHQDHRTIAELTWNTFRHHLVLEYEIPKYDGDLGRPNVYVPLSPAMSRTKARHLLAAFPSQRRKAWFTTETFTSILRLRGIEARAPQGYAEAFHGRKVVLDP
jgi:LmbE family N-acetylglucosaminyl deacetylase